MLTDMNASPAADRAGKLLDAVQILEFASFVAGPSGCMSLAQLGADVIRVDPVGGAADYHRWPVSARTGESLYWSALNKGKRSVAVDLRSPAGRELAIALATADGPGRGIVVDNSVGRTWLGYDALTTRRADVIQVHIQGHADGRPAVDYTVNPEVGVPYMTGPPGVADPVNHVLPAWDLLTGMTAATGLLAALHRRQVSGEGAFLQLALADVALAGVANLGWFAEAAELGTDRPRHGNHVYGSFGVDFATSDGQHVMVVALTVRQWHALHTVTKTTEVLAALEAALGVDFTVETDRYRLRETIAAILRPWFADRTFTEVSALLDDAQVLWSRYRSIHEAVEDFRSRNEESVLGTVEQPGIGPVMAARSPLRGGEDYGDIAAAPVLGQHTDEVLAQVLGLDAAQVGRLHDAGTVNGP
jgi:2-methylfumaryl-CoA isomerase